MCAALLADPKLKLNHTAIVREGADRLRITPCKHIKRPDSSPDASMLWYDLQLLKAQLMGVIVCGIPSVERAVINEKEGASGGSSGGGGGEPGGDGQGKSYKLLVEGVGLTHVMGVPGVKGSMTSSNHVIEVERVLGIEAARGTIMSEIQYTMGQHGMDIDTRRAAAHCTAPLHHCTTAPLHHCTTAPPHHRTTAPLHHRTTAPPHHRTFAPPHHCTTAPPHHCTTAPLHHCTTAPPHHCTTAAPQQPASRARAGTR